MNYILNSKIKNEVRQYTLKIIDQTVFAGDQIKIGDKLFIGSMEQLSDDYKEYEMNVFKPIWEKQLVNGGISQWIFTKVIAKNASALNKTHFTFTLNNKNVTNTSTLVYENKWINDKIIEMGLKTRNYISAEATLVYSSEN